MVDNEGEVVEGIDRLLNALEDTGEGMDDELRSDQVMHLLEMPGL